METFIKRCYAATEHPRAAACHVTLDEHLRDVYRSVEYLDSIQEYSNNGGHSVDSDLICAMTLSPLTDREGGAGGDRKGKRAARRASLQTTSAATGGDSSVMDVFTSTAGLKSEICKHISLYFEDLLTGDAVFRQPLPSLLSHGSVSPATKEAWTAVALSVVLCWATNAPLFEQWLQQQQQQQKHPSFGSLSNPTNNNSSSLTNICLKSTPTRSRCQSHEQPAVVASFTEDTNRAETFLQELLHTQTCEKDGDTEAETERQRLLEEWCFVFLQAYITDFTPSAWQSYLRLVRGAARRGAAAPLASSALLVRGLLFLLTVADTVGAGEAEAEAETDPATLPTTHLVRMNPVVEKELCTLYAQFGDGASGAEEVKHALIASILWSDAFWLLHSTAEFPSMWSLFYSMLEMEGDSDMDM